MAASSGVGDVDEATFVERFWTAQWRNRDRPVDVSAVAGHEAYRIMGPFLDRLGAGSRVLDGGCGMGEWSVFLAGRGFRVVGADISEETIARLKEWFPAIEFTRVDLRRTGFPPASFDAYFSWGTFEHFEAGLGGCLEEARRIVRPGGWLFVSVPFYNLRLRLNDSRRLPRWDHGFDADAGYRQPQRFYQWRLTRGELRRELELHGFKVHSVHVIDKQTGAGRMLQWNLPLFSKGSRAYHAAVRVLAMVLPGVVIGHMILAAGERRPT